MLLGSPKVDVGGQNLQIFDLKRLNNGTSFYKSFLMFFSKSQNMPFKDPGGGMNFAWKVIKNLLDTDPRGLKEAKKTFKC